ncbi:hypothetical protein D3C84_886800 [compost metagenome]
MLQSIGTVRGQLPFFKAIGATFGESAFLQAICSTFGQLSFLDAVVRTFGNVVGSGAGTARRGACFCSLAVRRDKTEGRKKGNS